LQSGHSASRRNPFFVGALLLLHLEGDIGMDKEHVKGVADKAKGAIKDTAKKPWGIRSFNPRARWTRRRADLHKAAGDLKDAVKHSTD